MKEVPVSRRSNASGIKVCGTIFLECIFFFFADSRISTVVRGVLCNTYAYTCMWIIVVNILNAIDGNWMTYTFTYKWSNTVVRPAVERDNQFGCNINYSLLNIEVKKRKIQHGREICFGISDFEPISIVIERILIINRSYIHHWLFEVCPFNLDLFVLHHFSLVLWHNLIFQAFVAR